MTKKVINNILIALFTSVIIAVVWNYKYDIYYFFLRLLSPKSKDEANNVILKSLHPVFGYKVSKMVKELENNNHTVRLTSGYRSPEKQAQLVASGATNTQPLNSYHNYGFALDLNVDNVKMASSKNSWLNIIGGLYEKYGLRWGGLFNNYDPVHFDFGTKYKISEIKEMYNNSDLVAGKFVKIW